jgi:methylenetetrahydrofolate reductase (NADPH)
MRIDELFASKHPLISFEFFPPRDEAGEKQLMTAVDELRPLNPDFVSITRTGGGTQPRWTSRRACKTNSVSRPWRTSPAWAIPPTR